MDFSIKDYPGYKNNYVLCLVSSILVTVGFLMGIVCCIFTRNAYMMVVDLILCILSFVAIVFAIKKCFSMSTGFTLSALTLELILLLAQEMFKEPIKNYTHQDMPSTFSFGFQYAGYAFLLIVLGGIIAAIIVASTLSNKGFILPARLIFLILSIVHTAGNGVVRFIILVSYEINIFGFLQFYLFLAASIILIIQSSTSFKVLPSKE